MSDSMWDAVRRSMQHLPEPVQKLLVGRDEEGSGGLVGSLLDEMLLNVERAARAPFKQSERRRALLHALGRGLGLALQRWQPESTEPEELERLRQWMRERIVSEQLLHLLRPQEDSRWDMARLCEELEESGVGAQPFGQSDGEAWLRLFVTGYYHGVAAERGLHELIALPLLRLLAERMGAQLVSPGEGEGGAAQLEYIRQLAYRLSTGESVLDPLLEEIQKLLATADSQGPVQQQAMFQTAQDVLGKAGLSSRQASGAQGQDTLDRTNPVLPAIWMQLEELRRWLDTSSGRVGEAELAQMEAHYLKMVRERFDRLTFKGISATGRAISLPLEEVYVELKVVAEVPEAVDGHTASERRLLQEADRMGALDSEQQRELDGLRYRRWRQDALQEQTRLERRGVDSSDVWSDKPAVVLLGDPGSGKTTLLHYLALRAMREAHAEADKARDTIRGLLPIFVPLAAYDEYLRRTDDSVALERFLAVYFAEWWSLRGLEPLFQRSLEGGRALVLFDGLDEVLELTTRRFVAEQVSRLLGHWVGRGNRFVLTSRFIGYREVQLSGDLPHYMVLDFRPEEIARFAHQWCEAFETWAAGGKRTEVALQRARQEEQALLADVNSKPSVAHLASNPLLLTMLALLRRQVGQLPARRIELYDRYVRMLLEHREDSRSEGVRRHAPARLDANVALQHLADLSLWLQQHRPSGTARHRDMVRAMTEMALRRDGKNPEHVPGKEWEEAERRATRCLKEVREVAGLMGERGQDAYGFLHLTFQEYLVGRALARESPERRWELLKPYMHDPRWHEPILLCAGQLGVIEGREGLVADLLNRILGVGSAYEELLYRDLNLAVSVIEDDVTRSSAVFGELRERLLVLRHSAVPSLRQLALNGMAHLARLGHDPALEKFRGWLDEHMHLREAIQTFGEIFRDELPVELREVLLERLRDKDAFVRRAVVNAIGGVVGSEPTVREALLERLGDNDIFVRRAVVEALGGVAGSDAKVREVLLERLGNEGAFVHAKVVEVLGGVAGGEAKVREALLERLGDNAVSVRAAAVEALGGVAGSDAKVREALLERLGDEDEDVRAEAVDALGGVAGSDAKVREALLERLGDEAASMRARAVKALGGVAGSEAKVREALLERLGDEGWGVRAKVVDVLGGVAGSDAKVREVLLERLGNEAASMRARAVKALGGVAGSDAKVREALLERLGDEGWSVRAEAVEALGGVAGSEAKVREALLERLGDEDWSVRAMAVKIFSDRDGLGIDMVERVLPWLGNVGRTDRFQIRTAVFESVSKYIVRELSRGHQWLERLLEMLHHPEWDTRKGAAMALMAMHGSLPEHATLALLNLLNDTRDEGNWPERLLVATALLNARDSKTSQKAIDCVMRALDYGTALWYDSDVSAPVRSQAAEVLGRLEPTWRNERVVARLVRLLNEDKQENVRDAAYHAVLRLMAAPAEPPHRSVEGMMSKKANDRIASILHLSDMHFETRENAGLWYDQLAEDLKGELDCRRLDGVVLSGDITNQSKQEGYDAARFFLEKLCLEFQISNRNVVMVPGNHDICRTTSEEAYISRKLRADEKLPADGIYIPLSNGYIASPEPARYQKRFERFARFYEQVRGEPYPMEYDDQGILYHLDDVGLLFLGLNSSWMVDHHAPGRASVRDLALARAFEHLRQDEEKYRNSLKVAVWHHPIEGEQDGYIKDSGFLDRLAAKGFRLALHGHIHKAENELYRYGRGVADKRLEIVSAGTFGAPVREWVPGYPLQYNLLCFQGTNLTVKTRCREKPNGAWRSDARWSHGKEMKSFYILDLT